MHFKKNILLLSLATLTIGCTNIDCPLGNVVTLNGGLYDAETNAVIKLSDTLTIKTAGRKDTVLLNRACGISAFNIPLRYTSQEDTLLFCLSNAKGQSATDTLFIRHKGTPHFESTDCPIVMFQELEKVRWTTHTMKQMPLAIDSVAITNKSINYDNAQNIKIYFHTVLFQ